MAQQPAPVPAAAAKIALLVALVAVALAGLRGAVPVSGAFDGPWHSQGVLLAGGLELVFAALLAVLERRHHQPGRSWLATGLYAQLRWALVTVMVIIPVLVLFSHLRLPHGAGHPLPVKAGPLPSRTPHPAHALVFDALVLYVLLALVLAGAVVACVYLVRRQRRTAWGEIGEVPAVQDEEQLQRAVRSGRVALYEIDDARMAIITCYLAMERSLAEAGAVRGDAETPDELLGRAAAAGLAQGGEAALLTALFYEARFSSHPMPPSRREEARRALEVLAAAAASWDMSRNGSAPSTPAGAGR